MTAPKGFPNLELVFDLDAPSRFLAEAAWRMDAASRASDKLVTDPPRGKYLRAMCILMALAKYHGPFAENPDAEIPFRETTLRNSWIGYMGRSFGLDRQTDFFFHYFNARKFLNFERGSAHLNQRRQKAAGLLPLASYYPAHLRLENLLLHKVGPKEKILLGHEDLRLLAKTLEKHGGWEPIVPDILARIDRNAPLEEKALAGTGATEAANATGTVAKTQDSGKQVEGACKPPEPPVQTQTQPLPYVLSDNWRELFQQVAGEMEGRKAGWDWYVVCDNPLWLFEWYNIICFAYRAHGANVKLAGHDLTSPCLSLVSHWRNICSHLAVNDPVAYGKDQADATIKNIKNWTQPHLCTLPPSVVSHKRLELFSLGFSHSGSSATGLDPLQRLFAPA